MSNSLSEQRRAVVDEYLDQLCEQLTSLPEARQLELRNELRQHLGMLMADWHGADAAPGAALGRLVREFGDPTTIGRDLSRQWQAPPPGRTAPLWAQRMTLAVFGPSLAFSMYLVNEMCRMFGWAADPLQYLAAGPLIPLALGVWWGKHRLGRTNMRWGYLGITAVNLLLATLLPLPDFIARIELPPATTTQMCEIARVGHLIVWLWLACSACGVTSILETWRAYLHERTLVT